jgi:hypothetical protein
MEPLALERMTDWVDFKRSFSTEQENAIWQYLIDHSNIQPNGDWSIQFYVHDIDDFWKRVCSGANGTCRRYEQKDKKTKQLNREALMQELHMFRAVARKHTVIVDRITLQGSWKERLALRLHRLCRDYLFGNAHSADPF